MAEKDKKEHKSALEAFEYAYKSDYKSDWDLHKDYVGTFDSYEAMLLGQVWDSVSGSVDGSKITDSYAATLAIERASRVMGKLPEGEVEASAKADAGKAAFMEILRQKWIYPNANAQHKFPIKLRMWQLYSSVYGYMPMFYDWNVTPSGYAGPDCWLWNPRNLVFQQGRTSIGDMDYVTALTWVGKAMLEEKVGKKKSENLEDGDPTQQGEEAEDSNDGWNLEAVQMLLDVVDGKISDTDVHRDTVTERTRVNQGKKKGICLATRYEAGEDGEWITFAPDHGYIEVRRIKNPHKNGKIPFVIKYGLPLYDSAYGLGDFQRAKPLQFARDGLTNFYFASIKRNLAPGLIVNANGVMKHTLDVTSPSPILMETIPNSIRPLPTNTAGLSTYQGAQSNLTGSLLSLYGSQNATAPGSETLNPSQGKTPQAIDLYSEKEATRDGQERELLEQAIEELTDGFFDLIINIGTEEIPVNLFAEDIEEIHRQGYSDIEELFKNFSPNKQQTSGELKIDPSKLKGAEYRFNVNRGSTAKLSKEKQRQSLADFMGILGKFQNVLQEDPNVQVEWGKIMKIYEELSDLKGAHEFITVKDGPTQQEMELIQQMEQMQQQMMQTQQQMEQLANENQQMQEALEDQQNRTVGGNTFNDPNIAEAARELAGDI